MSDPAGGGNRWRQYFQSSAKLHCSCFTVRAVSEVIFYLSETVMWHHSLCMFEYNVYLLLKKKILMMTIYIYLLVLLTSASLKIEDSYY